MESSLYTTAVYYSYQKRIDYLDKMAVSTGLTIELIELKKQLDKNYIDFFHQGEVN